MKEYGETMTEELPYEECACCDWGLSGNCLKPSDFECPAECGLAMD